MESHETATLSPEQLLTQYLAYLQVKRGRARSVRHVSEVARRVGRMLVGLARIEDVTPGFIETRMLELLQETVTIRGVLRTRSPQTIDNHRRELGTFFRWAIKKGFAQGNPIDRVDSYEAADIRDPSRPFAIDEAAAFFSRVPAKRLPVYLFWATSGVRPAETQRLLGVHAFLAPSDGTHPHVQILRATSKNRKAIRQPLHPDLVALLRQDPRAPEQRLFRTVPTEKTFLRDLRRAGLLPVRITAEGRLTRISLRKLFATALDRSGASAGLVQKLMRHSTSELTRERYTQYELEEKAHHVRQLQFLPDWRRGMPA